MIDNTIRAHSKTATHVTVDIGDDALLDTSTVANVIRLQWYHEDFKHQTPLHYLTIDQARKLVAKFTTMLADYDDNGPERRKTAAYDARQKARNEAEKAALHQWEINHPDFVEDLLMGHTQAEYDAEFGPTSKPMNGDDDV